MPAPASIFSRAAAAVAAAAAWTCVFSARAADQCQPHEIRPWWPTYHILGNVSRGPGGALPVKPDHLNDANAIFEYKSVFHVMHQGGGTWLHLTSTDLVTWTRRGKVFSPPPKNSSWVRVRMRPRPRPHRKPPRWACAF